jgi:hypothetical protein
MAFNKPDITQLSAVGSTVGDLYFPQTKLLLPFDGANGATTTSDLSNTNASVTFSSGDEIRTAQSKFGNSSLYVADNVTVSSSSGFNMGTGDFTIEGWWYFGNTSNSFSLYDQYAGGSSGVGNMQLWVSAANDFRVYYDGSNRFSLSTTFSTGQWYHLAFVRASGTIKVYVNGTADASTQSYSGQFGKTGTVMFGDQHSGGGGAPQYYLDDLRVTKGLARYTGNFTAPTTAHLTSAGDVNKQILINSAADGVAIGTGGINQARIAKAWVNFNGTGTVAIRGNYNVSSITDNGVGIYTVNFSSNMSDTNYAVSGSIGSDGTASGGWLTNGNNTSSHTVNNTTSSCRVTCNYQTSLLFDPPVLSVNIFGN